MRHLRTQAIILSRTEFGEADRIITFLTPDHGKLKAIAKGVRRSKSKLAGGIELFSVSDISFIPGRKDISTVVSTRLIKHYGNIVKDLDRTNTAYELIRRLHKATEDNPEPDYFDLMREGFIALDDSNIDPRLTDMWFSLQLLRLAGHSPNLQTDAAGVRLADGQKYNFDIERMGFDAAPRGAFSSGHIKLIRLGVRAAKPGVLAKVSGYEPLLPACESLAVEMLRNYVRQ